jgi:small subunit ribosomal protein S15
MALTPAEKNQIIKDYATFEGDTGTAQVQIALLTHTINRLSSHLTANKKDKHGQRGLQIMVGRRNGLTKYLRRKNLEAYRTLIERLGLRR